MLIPSSASGSRRDAARQRAGDAGLHEPRAGPRRTRSARPSLRFVQPGRYPLLPFDRQAGVRRRRRRRDFRAVQQGDFPSPRKLDPSIDRALEAICVKAMVDKPEDRYQSCRTLADDIERWMADEAGRGVERAVEPKADAVVDASPDRCHSRRRCHVDGTGRPGGSLGRPGPRQRRAETGQRCSVLGQCPGRRGQLRAQEGQRERHPGQRRPPGRQCPRAGAVRPGHGRHQAVPRRDQQGLAAETTPVPEAPRQAAPGAADFYGRLEELLKQRTDRESRVALGRALEELGELTISIGDAPMPWPSTARRSASDAPSRRGRARPTRSSSTWRGT